MLIKEHDLLRLLKDPIKKNGAFKNLVEQYKEQLYWVIRKVLLNHDDTDDVLQNTFMKIYLNIDNFNHNSKLFTWMYRIAINESINFINKKSKQVGLSNSEYIEEEAKKLESDVYFDGNKAELKLQQTISTLPPKQRMIFSMRYFDEMPFKQISKILSTNEGALRASYHQAVKNISNKIDPEVFLISQTEPFKTPDNYFDNFTFSLFKRRKQRIKRLSFISIAASITLIFGIWSSNNILSTSNKINDNSLSLYFDNPQNISTNDLISYINITEPLYRLDTYKEMALMKKTNVGYENYQKLFSSMYYGD